MKSKNKSNDMPFQIFSLLEKFQRKLSNLSEIFLEKV